MASERFQGLLAELGRRINHPNLEVDEFGRCTLNVGEEFQLTIYYDDDAQALTLFSALAEIPKHEVHARAPDLLRANLFWADTDESTLSMDPDSGLVLLARRLPEKALEYAAFEDAVMRFLAAAQIWHGKLREKVSLPPPPPASIPSQGGWRSGR